MPKPDDLGLIIEASGGKVTTRLPPAPSDDDHVRYFVVSCPADKVRAQNASGRGRPLRAQVLAPCTPPHSI